MSPLAGGMGEEDAEWAASDPSIGASLASRFEAKWRVKDWSEPGDRIAVACSGGMDSLTLLHLLRFGCPGLGLELTAAHFDHRMRPDGAAESAWLAGVAGAWNIEFESASAREIPRSEARARTLRYEFLHGLVGTNGIRWVLTAHQADDQIETLLFRIARGTGLDGLRGIPRVREPGVLRPMLPFSRAEIESYARLHHLSPRMDPSNLTSRFARNRVRHELIPLLEEIHPGARHAVHRLGRNAERAAGALEALVGPALDALTLRRDTGRIEMDRKALLAHPSAVRFELVRTAARALGLQLDEAGTAVAEEFITKGSSGGRVELPDGYEITREFDRVGLARNRSRADPPDPDGPSIRIGIAGEGRAGLDLAGRRFHVAWGAVPETGEGWVTTQLAADRLEFPVEVRGWRAGDRTWTLGGTKKLAKLFVERRIPRSERARIPIFLDAGDRVVWIPGAHLDPRFDPGSEGPRWSVGVLDVGHA